MSPKDKEIARLTRERDLAKQVALAAMGTMTDGQLAEMRAVLDRKPDDTQPDLPVIDPSVDITQPQT